MGIARAAVDQIVQLGIETIPGVRATTMRRLPGVSVDVKPLSETQRFRAMGFNVDTVSIVHKQWANGQWNGPVDFNQILYPLSGMAGIIGVAPVQIGATPGYTWDFKPVSSGADPHVKSFSLEYGDAEAVMLALQLQFQSLTMEWSNDNLNMSGNLFCRFPTDDQELTLGGARNEIQSVTIIGTGGTYKLTFNGQQTAVIAYNANAAAVTAALEALSNVAPGDVIVTGGPGGSATLFVEFAATYASTNIATMLIDDSLLTGPGHDGYVEGFQQGGAAGTETTIAQRPSSRMQVDIFCDDSVANLGLTKVYAAYEASLTVADKFQPFWALNTDYPSYADTVRVAAEVNGAFSTAHNAMSRALFATIRNNPQKFIRMQIKGDNLGANADELIQIDFAGRFAQPEMQKDANGVLGYKYNFNVIHDATLGGAYTIRVVNTLTGL